MSKSTAQYTFSLRGTRLDLQSSSLSTKWERIRSNVKETGKSPRVIGNNPNSTVEENFKLILFSSIKSSMSQPGVDFELEKIVRHHAGGRSLKLDREQDIKDGIADTLKSWKYLTKCPQLCFL